MASLPSGVTATACGGPCTVCSNPSTVPLTTGGDCEASMTTKLSDGAGSGKVARPSTRTNLPSCAETMISAPSVGQAHSEVATSPIENCGRKRMLSSVLLLWVAWRSGSITPRARSEPPCARHDTNCALFCVVEDDPESVAPARTQPAHTVAHVHAIRPASALDRAILDRENHRLAAMERHDFGARLH